jgi:T5SS/PEP-CTERM-associated repeat protein
LWPFLFVLLSCSFLVNLLSTLHADVIPDGSVFPTDLGTWTTHDAYIAYSADGGLTVNGDSDLSCMTGYIGHGSYAGTTVVTGAGSTWTTSQNLFVGANSGTGNGSMSIAGGGGVKTGSASTAGSAYIGYYYGSSGTVTISGAGSTWNGASRGFALDVGYDGTATLSISDHASVNTLSGEIATTARSVGTVNVTDFGTWNNSNRLTVAPYGKGILNVNGGSVRCTGATIGSTSSAGLGAATVNVGGIGSTLTSGEGATFDLCSAGTLNITDGGTVTSDTSTLKFILNSSLSRMSTAKVVGQDSRWNAANLSVGGYLRVADHGQINSRFGQIDGGITVVRDEGTTWNIDGGYSYPNTCPLAPNFVANGHLLVGYKASVQCDWGNLGGYALLDGAGSIWTNRYGLSADCGNLMLANGSTVTAGYFLRIERGQTIFDVRSGSRIIVGNGNGSVINNDSLVLRVDPGAAPGARYAPILAKYWNGTGSYSVVGGTWDPNTHEVVASDIAEFGSADPITIDRRVYRRLSVHDDVTGWTFRTSYGDLYPYENPIVTGITATAVSGSSLAGLQRLLNPGESVLSAWELGNWTPGYYCFDVGPGYTIDTLRVWHGYGSAWNGDGGSDMVYDGKYVSFTIVSFSSWAVTGIPVPEPTMLALLLSLGICLTLRRWESKQIP